MHFSKKPSYLGVSILCFALCVAGLLLLQAAGGLPNAPAALSAGSLSETATLSPIVTDANGRPIAGAVIVLPDQHKQISTAADGRTPPISVPIQRDARFDALCPQPWGEVLVLAYAPGYAPAACLYGGLYTDAACAGPIFTLQPAGSASAYTASSPTQAWVETLLQKYTPLF